MRLLIVLVPFIALVCGYSQNQAQPINFLSFGPVNQCEGKDASNYTFVNPFQLDSDCDPSSYNDLNAQFLVDCRNNSVINLQRLAASGYPAGAYIIFEQLYLCTSGTLEGKYVYLRGIPPSFGYMEKCSSVLGTSYVISKSFVLFIAEKLNMEMFVNPGGAFDVFRKSASTMCSGAIYTV